MLISVTKTIKRCNYQFKIKYNVQTKSIFANQRFTDPFQIFEQKNKFLHADSSLANILFEIFDLFKHFLHSNGQSYFMQCVKTLCDSHLLYGCISDLIK
jgi:hypothetical protein